MAGSHVQPGRIFGRFELRRRLRADPPYEHWLALDTTTGDGVEITLAAAPHSTAVTMKPGFGGRPCPEILPCLEQGTQDDLNYAVVPHRRGLVTLADYCRPDRLLAEEQIVPLFIAIAQALSVLHTSSGPHAMLTPASILVRGAADAAINLPKISGYLRLLPGNGGTNHQRYSAPELAAGEPTPASDLFSLGAILFELTAGRLPNTWRQALNLTTNAKWPPLRIFRAGVSDILERVTNKALHHNPAHRYRNVHAFGGDLSLLLDCPPVDGTDISPQGVFLAARALDCFTVLTDVELWEIVHACRWLNFDADALLSNDPNDGNNLYAVVAGSVAQFEQGRLVAHVSAGTCFGAHHLLRDELTATANYANAGTTLLAVPAAAIEQMSTGCQLALHQHLLQQLSHRLRKATAHATR
jgi:hypothetical protein